MLGVTNFQSPNTFDLFLANDVGGAPAPGAPLAEFDGLTTTESIGGCCGLVTILGITGVTLTGGNRISWA